MESKPTETGAFLWTVQVNTEYKHINMLQKIFHLVSGMRQEKLNGELRRGKCWGLVSYLSNSVSPFQLLLDRPYIACF